MTGLAATEPGQDSIGDYLRYSRQVLNDIDDAIDDLTFRQQGGEIDWAVDFTEIEAFVLPDGHGRNSPIDAALDIAVLERFFFGGAPHLVPSGIVLLPPHRVELRNAEAFFHAESLDRFQAIVMQAMAELRGLEADARFKEMVARLESAGGGDGRNALERELLHYLNDHAGALFLAMTQNARTPQGRLRELLEHAALIDASAIVGRTVAVSELDDRLVGKLTTAISERRIQRETERRGRSEAWLDDESRLRLVRSSTRDAQAVGFLRRINTELQTRYQGRRRLQLLTRSEVVHSEAYRYSTAVPEAQLDLHLRRIGAFRQASWSTGGDLQQRIAELRQRRRALLLAVRALRPLAYPDAGRGEVLEEPQLEARIAALRELWQGADNLTVAIAPWREAGKAPTAQILRILRSADRDRLNDLVRAAATQLSADITLNNALLGFFEGEGRFSQGSASFADPPKGGRGGGQPVLVWSRDTVSTIAVLFYDPVLRRDGGQARDGVGRLRQMVAARLPRAREDGHDPVTSAETERHPSLVEKCLASSFLEAIEDRWDSAFLFADMAVNWPFHLDSTPRHEAFYMRALTRRRYRGPTKDVLEACLADLDEASGQRRDDKGPNADPRYLLQQGICHFNFWEHVEGGRYFDVEAPQAHQRNAQTNAHIQQATELFERARTLAQAWIRRNAAIANRLLLDIANAQCYAHVSARGADGLAVRYYAELLRAVRDCQWTEETVPVSQLDTLVWTRFLLRARIDEREALLRSARILAERLPTSRRHQEDKAVVAAHLREIEAALGVSFAPRAA